MLHLYDILARTYGVLPSDISKLDWYDLMINYKALKARSERMQKVLKRAKRKKDMIFPTLNMNDLIDII